jgi:hypothetical protein
MNRENKSCVAVKQDFIAMIAARTERKTLQNLRTVFHKLNDAHWLYPVYTSMDFYCLIRKLKGEKEICQCM